MKFRSVKDYRKLAVLTEGKTIVSISFLESSLYCQDPFFQLEMTNHNNQISL